MRNKYIHGKKDESLNAQIIELCGLESYQSKYRILEHFHHTDTYIDNEHKRVRLQGYVYPKDLYNEQTMTQIDVPDCEVSYMDGEIILYMTMSYPFSDPATESETYF